MEPKKNLVNKAFMISLAFHAVVLFPMPDFTPQKSANTQLPQLDYLVLADTTVQRKIPKTTKHSTSKRNKKIAQARMRRKAQAMTQKVTQAEEKVTVVPKKLVRLHQSLRR